MFFFGLFSINIFSNIMLNPNFSKRTNAKHSKRFFESNTLLSEGDNRSIKKKKTEPDFCISEESSESSESFSNYSEYNEDAFYDSLFSETQFVERDETNSIDYAIEADYITELCNQVEESDSEDPPDSQNFSNESNQVKDFLDGLLDLMIKNKGTYEIFDQVLKLTKRTLCEQVPSSYKTLINRALKDVPDLVFYSVCSNSKCQKIVSYERKNSKSFCCPFCSQQIVVDSVSGSSKTVSLSLENQIKKLSENFPVDDLKGSPASLEDPFVLEIVFSLDGVPLSGSSKVQLYPVHCYILNIKSSKARNRLSLVKSFTVVRKKQKPNYEQMLTPFIDEYLALTDGFKTKWSNKTKLKAKIFLADAPCRAGVLNMMQHNGESPCHKCLVRIIPQKELKEGQKKEDCYIVKSDDMQRRSKGHFEDSVILVEQEKLRFEADKRDSSSVHYAGVKGKTILSLIPNFDYVTCTLAEIMHVVFLGLTKLFLSGFWNKSGNIFYLEPYKKELVDKKISSLNVPSSVVRSIRSFDDLNNFKSTELQFYLFYYSYFIFKDVLDDLIFNHFMLLSSSMFKVYSRNSTPSDIDNSQREVDAFLDGLDLCKYADKGYKIYNMHMLPHVVQDRVNFLPLADLNAYSYENDLQLDKKDSKSLNVRVVSFAQKSLLRVILNIKTYKDNQTEKFKNKNIIKSRIDEKLLDFLKRKFETEKNDFIFFNKAKNREYNFTSLIYFEDKKDGFVKVDKKFYGIIVIFKFKEKSFCLLKKVCILGERKLSFENFEFTLNQIKLVHQSFSIENLLENFKDDDFFIFEFKKLKSHCMYVEQKEKVHNLRNQLALVKYLVDMEH